MLQALRAGLLLAVLLLGRSASAKHVVVLQSGGADAEGWAASAHTLIAELALAGFTVSVQRLASDVDITQHSIAVAAQSNVLAAVSIERRGDVSEGLLWLHDAQTPIRVAERTRQAVVGHSVVALKLTALLLERNLELPPAEAAAKGQTPEPAEAAGAAAPEAAQSVPNPTGEAPASVPSETVGDPRAPGAAASPSALSLWVGSGLGGFGRPSVKGWQLAFGAQFAFLSRFSIALGAALPLGVMSAQTPLGTAQLRASELNAELLVAVLRSSLFGVSLGPRVSYEWLSARAQDAQPGYAAQTARARFVTLGADLQGTLRLGAHGLLGLLVRPGYVTPEPRLLNDSAEGLALGRLRWSALLVLGWEFAL